MSGMGSFNPLQNPDIDRLSYYLGQIIDSEGEILIDSTDSNLFYLGSQEGDKRIYFNINGKLSQNPGMGWNQQQGSVQFSYDGIVWHDLESILPAAGGGIGTVKSAEKLYLQVKADEIIDASKGLTQWNNKIQCNFGTGADQPARGNHTHSYSLQDLTDISDGTPAMGRILSANGSVWNSLDPHNAGIVTLSGLQEITGGKTFSGGVTMEGNCLFKEAALFQKEAVFEDGAAVEGETIFKGETDFEEAVRFKKEISIEGEAQFKSGASFDEEAAFSLFIDLKPIEEPSAPSQGARLYVTEDSGGKAKLWARFPAGSPVLLGEEPE